MKSIGVGCCGFKTYGMVEGWKFKSILASLLIENNQIFSKRAAKYHQKVLCENLFQPAHKLKLNIEISLAGPSWRVWWLVMAQLKWIELAPALLSSAQVITVECHQLGGRAVTIFQYHISQHSPLHNICTFLRHSPVEYSNLSPIFWYLMRARQFYKLV